MKDRIIAAAILSFAFTGASAQGLKQVATIQIPGVPINQFGSLYIDQPSGLSNLATTARDDPCGGCILVYTNGD